MFKIPMDVFAYTNEAAAAARGERIIFANAAAKELLGADCEGKKIADVLGPEIAEAQASNFVADLMVSGKSVSVRASKQENGRFFFFSKQEYRPRVLNEAFLYSINTNLMTMSLALELCRSKAEEQGNTEQLEALHELCRSQFRLSRMASNLSMVMDSLNDTLVINPRLMDLSWLCRDCVDCAASLVEGIEFRVNAREGLLVMADPGLLKRLLMNLLSNSLIHGKGLDRISVNLIESPDTVIVSVSDNGCGIASDRLHQVFDRYRHAFPMEEMNRGTGIGLSIVRLIAQRHGGTMLIESKADSGTTVRVSLKRGKVTPVALHSCEDDIRLDMTTALLELSDCLDSKYYGEKYLD